MINLFKNDTAFATMFTGTLESELMNANQVESFYVRVSREKSLPMAAGACPAMCINAADPASASVEDDDPSEPYIIEPRKDGGQAEITVRGLPRLTDCWIFLIEKSIIESIRKEIAGGQAMSTKEVVRELFCVSEEHGKTNFLKITTLSCLPRLVDKTDEFGELKTASTEISEEFNWHNGFVAVYYNGE